MQDAMSLRMPSSTKRHPVGGYRDQSMREQAQQIIDDLGGPPTRRATRNQSQQSPTGMRTNRTDVQRRMTHAPDTYEDEQVAPSTRSGRTWPQPSLPNSRQSSHQVMHPLVWIILGVFATAVVWSLGIHVIAWYTNTLHDPIAYTQTAHKDSISVTDAQGRESQARAFVDTHHHLDLLIIPEGDTTQAHVLVGPFLSLISDPEHQAKITVTARGTNVTVMAQGPLIADLFVTSQQTQEWSVDISQKQQ